MHSRLGVLSALLLVSVIGPARTADARMDSGAGDSTVAVAWTGPIQKIAVGDTMLVSGTVTISATPRAGHRIEKLSYSVSLCGEKVVAETPGTAATIAVPLQLSVPLECGTRDDIQVITIATETEVALVGQARLQFDWVSVQKRLKQSSRDGTVLSEAELTRVVEDALSAGSIVIETRGTLDDSALRVLLSSEIKRLLLLPSALRVSEDGNAEALYEFRQEDHSTLTTSSISYSGTAFIITHSTSKHRLPLH